ncbi:hypothetical protein K402DRAFT_455161 [Aulographum hederae CBS 113979]|uniref:Zn(2)-C6 fungal-type domain-containing protein n=1 Tax=Aulographum hederae CBS 113979 TaxID=1176131 RepID=A0A6G1GWM3_9PEZI|nr:hypothetical protein K402DRAFT_455161 [Aulographum hederae CBS 113979]
MLPVHSNISPLLVADSLVATGICLNYNQHAEISPGAATGTHDGGESLKPTRAAGSRRISTSNACVECRRRKIRCDGTQPCGQCQWYQHPEACSYSKPAQRVVPSRKLVEKLNGQIEQYQNVMGKLFSNKDIESLAAMPREELLNLALSAPASTSPSMAANHLVAATPKSEGAESLETLEEKPDHYSDYDDRRLSKDKLQSISDDVGGLSLSVDRHYSYVGASSTTAALKTIVRVAPLARNFISQQSVSETVHHSRESSPPPLPDASLMILPSPAESKILVQSYFDNMHLFFPMIDEKNFWSKVNQEKKDSSWLSLLNMVYALGSLALGTADNEQHIIFYKRAKQHLNLEGYGRGNLEVLQALGIMSGYYMHYLNRPNEAYATMGACFRMAVALGLHREYAESTSGDGSRSRSNSINVVPTEIRRRTWWSIFCLDTLASTTTGRPSFGRTSGGITVNEPGKAFENQINLQDPEYLKALPIIHTVTFCKMSTIIQDRLSTSPVLRSDELNQLDADLVRWYEDLPAILTTDPESTIPAFLRVPRLLIKWHYQNLRMLMHRPYLLSVALRGFPFSKLGPEERLAVGKCRVLASQTIQDISAECPNNIITGWNAVWLVFQACFVPLISLFSDHTVEEETQKWAEQLEIAIRFFERMDKYSVAAKRSRDAVANLLAASKTTTAAAAIASAEAEFEREALMLDGSHGLNGDASASLGMDGMKSETGSGGGGGGGLANQQMFPNNFNISTMVGGVGMAAGVWPDVQSGNGMGGLWDDMMWDTFPDVTDQLANPGEHEWPPSTNGNGWMGS